jgi:hypothetical protein
MSFEQENFTNNFEQNRNNNLLQGVPRFPKIGKYSAIDSAIFQYSSFLGCFAFLDNNLIKNMKEVFN